MGVDRYKNKKKTREQRTWTEPCRSFGVRFPSVAPDFWMSDHAATPPFELAFCRTHNTNSDTTARPRAIHSII